MKSKVHDIKIRVRFDAPLSKKQAEFAIRNQLHRQTIYGDGIGARNSPEAFAVAKITVPK